MISAEPQDKNSKTGMQAHFRIPLSIHLACFMLLVAVTICYGPLGSFFL